VSTAVRQRGARPGVGPGDKAAVVAPHMDISEDDKEIRVVAEMPGLDPPPARSGLRRRLHRESGQSCGKSSPFLRSSIAFSPFVERRRGGRTSQQLWTTLGSALEYRMHGARYLCKQRLRDNLPGMDGMSDLIVASFNGEDTADPVPEPRRASSG
jgi:hypothetical protein